MKFAVLFRALNVGEKNQVCMRELRELLTELGFRGVKTYIQSGNAVLESPLTETSLRERIQSGFRARFGFDGGAVLRSADSMRAMVERPPFTPEEIAAAEATCPEVEHLYVYFLSDSPGREQLEAVLRDYEGPDLLCAGEQELYLLCRQSIRKSKLVARAAKQFDSTTVRNWKTVCKLCELMNEY